MFGGGVAWLCLGLGRTDTILGKLGWDLKTEEGIAIEELHRIYKYEAPDKRTLFTPQRKPHQNTFL
jgi:hypothetical protein